MFAHNASVCQKSCHAGFLCPGAQLPSDVAVWASAKIIEDNSIRCRAIHMGHKYLSYSYCRWPLSRRLLVALWSSVKHEKTDTWIKTWIVGCDSSYTLPDTFTSTVKAVQLLKYGQSVWKCFGCWVAGAHIILYRSPQWTPVGLHSKSASTQRTTSPHWPSVHPSATSVFLHWSIHVLVLHSSDPLWCLIPSCVLLQSTEPLCQSWISKGLLTWQDYPPFQSHWGQFFSHKKTHSIDLLRSRFVSLAFLCSLTRFCLCPSRLSLNILIHPIQEFICRSSTLSGTRTDTTIAAEPWDTSWLMIGWHRLLRY